MNAEQFQHCVKALYLVVSQEAIPTTNDELLDMSGPECFEIGMSYNGAEWPYVIHDSNKDGVFYIRDDRFKAHHYACREAFQEAILAHGGTKCKRCNLYHRDIDEYCKLCSKVVVMYPEDFDSGELQDNHDYHR